MYNYITSQIEEVIHFSDREKGIYINGNHLVNISFLLGTSIIIN